MDKEATVEGSLADLATLPLLTVDEAATLMRCHRDTVLGMIEDGRLRALELGVDGKRPFRRVHNPLLQEAPPVDAGGAVREG